MGASLEQGLRPQGPALGHSAKLGFVVSGITASRLLTRLRTLAYSSHHFAESGRSGRNGVQEARTVRAIAPLVLALVLAGCVSLSPQQEQKLDEIQRLADRTTALYDLPRIRISIQPSTNLNIGATYRQGNVFVNVRMLDSPNL